MLSEFKKFAPYFLLLFIISAILGIFFRGNHLATSIWLGVALVTGLCFVCIQFGPLLSKNKNIWYTENLVPDNDAIFIFGEDPRPDADEIVKSLGIIYDHGIHRLDLTMFGESTLCIFLENDFLCPFETSISNTLCVSEGTFYRMKDNGPYSLGEFEAISFSFLSELNRALKVYVEKLNQPI